MASKSERRFTIFSPHRKKLPRAKYEKMSALYDKLYEKADLVLKKYNPCKIEKGKCFAGHPCCSGCEFLSKKKGCKTKSLACKLWLCNEAKKKFRMCAISLRKIEKAADRNHYILLGYRSIKEDILSHYEIVD